MTDRQSDDFKDTNQSAGYEAPIEATEPAALAPQEQPAPAMPDVPDLLARITDRIAAEEGETDASDYEALDGMRDKLRALKEQASGSANNTAEQPAWGTVDDVEETPNDPSPHFDAPNQHHDIAPHTIDAVNGAVVSSAEEPWTDASAEQLTTHCEAAGLATGHTGANMLIGNEGSNIPADNSQNYVYLEPNRGDLGQQWLENRLDEIAKRLDVVGDKPAGEGSELGPLLDRFDTLEARIDNVLVQTADGTDNMAGGATSGSLHDIELCIAEIATQLEATNSELTRIGTIEDQITEIAQAIVAQRDAAPEPATDPSAMFDMAALADLVADKVGAQPLTMAATGGTGESPVDAAGISELSTVMKDFMRERRSEGEHANAVLDTMQQTIIRVLDRMEALETGGPRASNVAPHAHAAAQPPQEPQPAVTNRAAAAPADQPIAQPPARAPVNEPAQAKPSASIAAAQSAAADDTASDEEAASLDRLQRVMGQLGDQHPAGQRVGKSKPRPQQDTGAPAPVDASRSSRTDFIKAARQAASKANQPAGLQPDEALEPDRTMFATAARQAAAKVNKRLINDDVYEDEIDATDDGFSSDSIGARLPLAGKTNNRARLLVAAVAIVAVGLVATKFMMSISSDAARKELQSNSVRQSSQIGSRATSEPARTVGSVQQPAASQLSAARVAQNAVAGPRSQSVTPGSVSYDPAYNVQAQPTAVAPQDAALGANQPLSGGPGSVSRKALPSAMVGPLSLRLAAANGDPSAEFQVATRFADGKGVKQDFDEAIKWYQRSSSRGFALAQYRLGTFYERGLGVDKDLGRAQVWYERAAANDNIKAMHNLAVLAAGSSTGKPDYVTAAQWFTKAAERGLADSQFNLAILYQNGLGVAQDDANAYKWFSLAATSGDKEAIRRMADLGAKFGKAQAGKLENDIRRWMRKPSSKMANDPHYAGQAWQRKSS